jgi:7-cyano-7-deazaguanine synthase
MQKQYSLVLLSGGIDSASCINFYLEQNHCVEAIHIDYGQKSAEKELIAAQGIANYYKIPIHYIKLDGGKKFDKGDIIGRNSLLLNIALINFNMTSGIIALGVHSGTSYVDCSEAFINSIQHTFDLYTNGNIIIGTPFIKWNKLEIWRYAKLKNIPLNTTYSCELGLIQPCNECVSCKDLNFLYAS